jgi:hypothetical protein
MDLKQIPRLGSDGVPTTDICIIDEPGHHLPTFTDGRIVWNLGSSGNGGLGALIQLANSINRFFLESSLNGMTDGVAESRSFGLVHLTGRLLDQFGMANPDAESLEDQGQSQSTFNRSLPSLLAALLDKSIQTAAPVEHLHRKVFFPKHVTVSARVIRELLSGTTVSGVAACPGSASSSYSKRLRTWAIQDGFPQLSAEAEAGVERISRMAQFIRATSEERTGSSWESIASHLNTLHAIRVNLGARTVVLTTRPTATQLSIFCRLRLPVPPLVFEENKPNANTVAVCEKDPIWPQFELERN